MSINPGLMSSKEIRWVTPDEPKDNAGFKGFSWYKRKYNINLDVCASPDDRKLDRYIAPVGTKLPEQWNVDTETWVLNVPAPVAYDGLITPWNTLLAPGESAWMNPPYGRGIRLWIEKARAEAQRGIEVVSLLPSRTDTRWWHENCQPIIDGKEPGRVEFVRGRVHFRDANTGKTGPAPFPSVVVIFGEMK